MKNQMEMAHHQKYLLNALFKRNQLFEERERQANNIKLGEASTRHGTANPISSNEPNVLSERYSSPESYRHFKHISMQSNKLAPMRTSQPDSLSYVQGRLFSPP